MTEAEKQFWQSANAIEEIRKQHNLTKPQLNPPVPDDAKERFELFKSYYGAIAFEIEKSRLFDNGILNEETAKGLLEIIEDFISDAEQINTWEAFKDKITGKIKNADSEPHEYLRLKNGFYNEHKIPDIQMQLSSLAANTYGKYFLLRAFLQKELRQPVNVFDTLFVTETAKKLVLEMFEELEITKNGKYNVTHGRTGKFFAAVIAIKESGKLLGTKTFTEDELLQQFNLHFGCYVNPVKKTTNVYLETYDDAERFIKLHFKK